MTENDAIEELKFNNEKCLEQCEGACFSRKNNDCACQDTVIERMLDELLQYRAIGTVEELREAASIVKKAERDELAKIIDEWLSYSKIGTVKEFREAVEKQKAKPCEFYGDEEDGKLLCPNCGEDLWELKECGFNNCPYCGQAIDENLEVE